MTPALERSAATSRDEDRQVRVAVLVAV